MVKTVAVLATLDTKGDEALFLKERIEAAGCRALLVDLGVLGKAAAPAGITREQVAAAGGTPLADLARDPTRQRAFPVMIQGASRLLAGLRANNELHAAIGLGGTQGTSICTRILHSFPYGFPKLMVSTVASGDVSSFVDIHDVTMVFSVCDILGLNPIIRAVLANVAAAACGMADACAEVKRDPHARPAIGMTNLGVLTDGAMIAKRLFEARGFEVILFHAVGAGGLAMERMMQEGIIGAVFDYGLGEISDELFHGLRAGSKERLTVAGRLGLPQVIVPGGTEHIGLIVEPNQVPERWRDHQHVFHSPIIFAPRLDAAEFAKVGAEIGARLRSTTKDAVLMLPLAGTSRYGKEGGPLRDPASDRAFFAALKAATPKCVRLVERDLHAEEEAFVREAVETLLGMVEARGGARA